MKCRHGDHNPALFNLIRWWNVFPAVDFLHRSAPVRAPAGHRVTLPTPSYSLALSAPEIVRSLGLRAGDLFPRPEW